MKLRELRELKPSELDSRYGDLRQELFNLRFQDATRQLTNSARLRAVRRDIARMETVRREMAAREAVGVGV